jgi:hypothetical protein
VAVDLHGLSLGIRLTDASLLPRAIERLPVGSKLVRRRTVDHMVSVVVGGAPRGSIRRFNVVYAGGLVGIRTLDLAEAFDFLALHLEEFAALWSPQRLFVHAGVVGWKGRAILIPGRSHSGKSTLVAALLRAGATYYSDEYALIGDDGRVHPYPRPLRLRSADGTLGEVPAATPGGRRARAPLEVGLVLMARYAPGARWRPSRLSEGRGVLALLSHTVAARARPKDAMATLGKVVRRAPVYEGRRGEAQDVVTRLLDMAEAR